jgi:hypothetical protein
LGLAVLLISKLFVWITTANVSMKSLFISISDKHVFHGNMVFEESIEVSDYSLTNMPYLLQKYLGIETINFNRQRTFTSACTCWENV